MEEFADKEDEDRWWWLNWLLTLVCGVVMGVGGTLLLQYLFPAPSPLESLLWVRGTCVVIARNNHTYVLKPSRCLA